MKIIVSHDVDHLFLTEHWKDRFLLGLLWKSTNDVLKNRISVQQFLKRFSSRLHRLPELIAFNTNYGAPSHFFFGMANGLSLSYSFSKARPIIQSLLKEGHFIGVHGMAFDDLNAMRLELERMKEILGQDVIGIRNHYLRQSKNTKHYMSELGYQFDSTDRGFYDPHIKDGLWSIPISVMDVDVIKPGVNADKAIASTLNQLETAMANDLRYFVINFHDIYFDASAYPVHYQWYTSLVNEIKKRNLRFTSFQEVLKELNQRESEA